MQIALGYFESKVPEALGTARDRPSLQLYARRAIVLVSLFMSLSIVQWHQRAEAAEPVPPGGLLRNGDFQDDWLTLIPELKNHHWNYTTDVFNRRDYNPDSWNCSGSWQWEKADAPRGGRRLRLSAPSAEVNQSVNWATVHNPASLSGWPDAGGYPSEERLRSKNPQSLVRDLTLKVKVTGKAVPASAGEIILEMIAGTTTVSASAALPAGNYDGSVVAVTLKAGQWLAKAGADPQAASQGTLLPGSVNCRVLYKAAAGSVVLESVTLEDTAPAASDLAVNGGFEQLDSSGYPAGWSPQAKYFYFPPGIYYNFNTWHNSNSDNRGPIAADSLVSFRGRQSLKMIVAAGDEKYVASPPIVLNQTAPRLIEATAWIKTDRLSTIQLDAEDEKGQRLKCYNFIQKYPLSIGTSDWRQIRQVFSPAAPVKSIRIRLAARGVNGYTLDDTSRQPQSNVVGTVWWDDLRVYEPESSAAELAARGIRPAASPNAAAAVHLENLELGEATIGDNELTATIVSPARAGTYTLAWEFISPSGKTSKFASKPVAVTLGGRAEVRVPYTLTEPCPTAYTEYHGKLKLIEQNSAVDETKLWFGIWTMPINLELGSLYLLPDRSKQFVKANLGLSHATLQRAASLRLQVVRRATGQVMQTTEVPATPAALQTQRDRVPQGMRNDLFNLLLADLDVSALPIQPFNAPERNWIVRATVVDQAGKPIVAVDSQPFCRLAHDPPQPPIQTVRIDNAGLLYVNNQPWMPWGVTYGHNPVYFGPADPGSGKYHDLHNLKPWGIYDLHGGNLVARSVWDANCVRWVAGAVSKIETLQDYWTKGNLYCSSAFAAPSPAWSMEELAKLAGGKEKLDAYLAYCKTAPMVVSTAPGVEEAFGGFTQATDAQIAGMKQAVDYLRSATGKPVMVGHGGYWNRVEFERIPFFDIYDPETEPLYPANLHTDMRPLIGGQAKVAWLRPQMYEDVPFERWRFHVFVELMRGARGWQVAHGPGDPSIFRGLHAELEFIKPILYSNTAPPKVALQPSLEHMTRKLGNKTYIVAASTHGMSFGTWQWADAPSGPGGRARVTDRASAWRDDTNGYSVNAPPLQGPLAHGIQYLTDIRTWSAGAKLVQWVKLDSQARPDDLVMLVKANGRWTHAASWGKFDVAKFRADHDQVVWFLRIFYRHAAGFMGWGSDTPPAIMALLPERVADMGQLPANGEWVKLEVPLDRVGADGKPIDGVGFIHHGGRVLWGRTSIMSSDGTDQVVFGDHEDRPSPEQLAKTKISLAGMAKGTKVRVLFEDREIVADDGYFSDDFRGQDLYERFGAQGTGYGDAPVSLHLYEVPGT